MDQQSDTSNSSNNQFEQNFVQNVQDATAAEAAQQVQKKTSLRKWGIIGGIALVVIVVIVVVLVIILNNQKTNDYSELSCNNGRSSLVVKYTEDEILSLESENIPLDTEDQKTAAKLYGVSYVVDDLKEWFQNNTADAVCEIK